LNIGTNIAFGNITAGFAGTTQNMDHLTVINSLADIPSVLFGRAFGTGYTAQASVAMALTALTKNPFIGLVGGILVRYIGLHFGLVE